MATRKHSVNVLIKARDEASKKFLRIGGAAKVMGRMLKSAGSVVKSTFVAAVKAAKYAVMGLGAALIAATYAALKQEAAEVELASALKITGQYSDKTMEKLKAQASVIQDATKYGDEYILSLMRMALTLGVTKDKAEDAAKAAIALHAGFGGGRGKPEIFLRYYIDALRGTGSSLESYVGELRKAKTAEEKMLILQKNLAKGWDVAKSKAESTGGALSQMKNKLWDIAEVIAAPLLPAIKRSSQAITAWAKENEANIAWWAQKTFSYVTFVKDVFLEYVDFMKKDVRGGFRAAFDVALELTKGFGKSFLAVMKNIFTTLGFNITGWIHNAFQMRKSYKQLVKNIWADLDALGATQEATKGMLRTPGGNLVKKKDIERVRPTVEKEAARILSEYGSLYPLKPTHEIGAKALIEDLKRVSKETLKAIKEKLPAEFRKGIDQASEKLEKRLKEFGKPPGKGKPVEAGRAEAPSPFSMSGLAELLKKARSETAAKLAPLEARFLTFKPGQRFDIERRQVSLLDVIARNTAKMASFLQKLTPANVLKHFAGLFKPGKGENAGKGWFTRLIEGLKIELPKIEMPKLEAPKGEGIDLVTEIKKAAFVELAQQLKQAFLVPRRDNTERQATVNLKSDVIYQQQTAANTRNMCRALSDLHREIAELRRQVESNNRGPSLQLSMASLR